MISRFCGSTYVDCILVRFLILLAFDIFLKKEETEAKVKGISDVGTKKESKTGQTGSKQEVAPGQASKQDDSISENIACERCGKTILRGFKICPYCGNIRSTNFPL
jgi:hypothetical protein